MSTRLVDSFSLILSASCMYSSRVAINLLFFFKKTSLHRRCNGLKQFRLVALPEILTLHLKRFSSNHLYSSKLSSPVNFPLKNLDLSPYLHRDCTDKVKIISFFPLYLPLIYIFMSI